MGRKPLSNKTRFEVFKRDSFTCQYCGRSSPDVILEVDHIVPVSKGGTNDILNLITSCRECNSGKSNRFISDKSTIERQKKQLDDMNELRLQTQMMIEWKQELLTITETQVDALDSLISTLSGYGVNDNGRKDLRKLIKRFGFKDVYTATELSYNRYSSWEQAFFKIGGICYNREKEGTNRAE